MEVKSGYKQTEVGVIPEEWEVSSIGSLCAAVLDCHHSTPVWTASGSVVIRNQNIRDGKLDLSQPSYTDEIHFAERTKRAVPSFGDLVITREAPMGLVCMIPKDLKCCLGQRMVLLRPNHDAAATEYLLYALLSEPVQRSISVAGGTGSTVSNLRIPVLKGLEISAPPLPEQRAIAEALSDVDGLLGGLDRLIAKKRDLKQAAMQQLLTGQTRLPGFHGEWDLVALGSLFSFKNGLNKGKEFFGYGTPIVNYMDVFGNTGILCSKLEGRVSLTKQEIKNFDVRKGDVFFTRTSETPEEIGMASVILDEPNETVFSGFVLRARPKNDILCDAFKAYCFRAPLVRNQIISKASYTTRALTNGRILSAVTLSVPTKAEQTAIAEVLSEMDLELAALEQRREKTRALKQAMMQELLTGRTRLV